MTNDPITMLDDTKKAIRELPDGRLYIVQGVNDEPHKVNATTTDLKALVDRLDALEEAAREVMANYDPMARRDLREAVARLRKAIEGVKDEK